MSFKKAVQASFSRAAGTYSDFSEVQQKAADDLVSLLDRTLPQLTSCRVLDIGCGPGILEARLRQRFTGLRYVGIDLSFEMTAEAQKKVQKTDSRLVVADMDSLPFHANSFDIVVSSSTLQWSEPEDFPWVAEIYRVLSPGGIFCFNLMKEGSLDNFYRVYSTVCQETTELHRYPDIAAMNRKIAGMFAEEFSRTETYRKNYSGLLAFLRDVQRTGARSAHLTGKGGLSKSSIREMERILKNGEGEVPIDYRFYFSVARKV